MAGRIALKGLAANRMDSRAAGRMRTRLQITASHRARFASPHFENHGSHRAVHACRPGQSRIVYDAARSP